MVDDEISTEDDGTDDDADDPFLGDEPVGRIIAGKNRSD
jgi:hypothetical protein